MIQISELIKNERERLRLTEDEVAEKIGIPRSTYQYWEKKTPSVEKIGRIEEALGLSKGYFFIKQREFDEFDETTSLLLNDNPPDKSYLEKRRDGKNNGGPAPPESITQ